MSPDGPDFPPGIRWPRWAAGDARHQAEPLIGGARSLAAAAHKALDENRAKEAARLAWDAVALFPYWPALVRDAVALCEAAGQEGAARRLAGWHNELAPDEPIDMPGRAGEKRAITGQHARDPIRWSHWAALVALVAVAALAGWFAALRLQSPPGEQLPAPVVRDDSDLSLLSKQLVQANGDVTQLAGILLRFDPLRQQGISPTLKPLVAKALRSEARTSWRESNLAQLAVSIEQLREWEIEISEEESYQLGFAKAALGDTTGAIEFFELSLDEGSPYWEGEALYQLALLSKGPSAQNWANALRLRYPESIYDNSRIARILE